MSKYIAVTGAVGAGATTLVNFIAEKWKAETLLEGQIEALNPFFQGAQHDPHRWSFASQAHFLAASARRHDDLRQILACTEKPIVLEDRTPFEHTGVYANSAHRLGHILQDEFRVLTELSRVIERSYLVPALLVYREMTDDQLIERVAVRGRQGESTDFARLKSVHDAFKDFISNWQRSPVVRIGHDWDLFSTEGQQRTIDVLSAHLGKPTLRDTFEHPLK
ncbi:Deoxyadenosine/deoxycytidine kinase [Pseudarthrobacter equi]|uniref:Deoxyadenosine/deoxycytidine kinase n=1 Tax=Pseudarthrobacter equi TaxID=728066 RepID=A0A1H1WQD4_9MICC|nr:deoxynucleoside kinase [Pseudarthrobacter equi]SDS99294.1 Deoxyadenosine/deoxycytidine kinase [Pseudarthrobacter equi]